MISKSLLATILEFMDWDFGARIKENLKVVYVSFEWHCVLANLGPRISGRKHEYTNHCAL